MRKDFLNFLGQDQRGQVQHHAHADSGPDVGWTRCQVAPLLVEREVHLLLQQVVDLADLFPARIEVEAAPQYLNAQVWSWLRACGLAYRFESQHTQAVFSASDGRPHACSLESADDDPHRQRRDQPAPVVRIARRHALSG